MKSMRPALAVIILVLLASYLASAFSAPPPAAATATRRQAQQRRAGREPPLDSTPCVDGHAECAVWANHGECDMNAQYMKVQCPVSCGSCNDPQYSRKIQLRSHDCDEISADALREGDIGVMMGEALTFEAYSPVALSRDPWVIQFDHFVTDAEAAEILQVGGHTFERSLAGFGDGVLNARTSSTSWCNTFACENHPAMVNLKQRILDVLKLNSAQPLLNTEHLQAAQSKSGPSDRMFTAMRTILIHRPIVW